VTITDNNKTFTATILAFAKMMALLSNIAIAATLSRLLPKSTYGTFCQILIINAMSSTVIASGLTQSVYYFLPRIKPQQHKGFVLQSISLLAGFGILICICLFFGADVLGCWWNNEELPALLRTFAFYPVFILPVMIAESVLMFFNRIYMVFLFNFISTTLTFFVVAIPIFLGYSILFSIRCWIFYAFLQFVVAITLVLRTVKSERIEFKYDLLITQCKYFAPLALAAILGVSASYIDRVLINIKGNSELFAVYFNGAFELPLVGVIGGAVTVTILSLMSRYAKENRFDEFLGLWHRSQTKVAFVLFPVWMFFLFFAYDAIVLLFSKSYTQSVIIFQIYLCLIPARLCPFNRIIVPLNKNWIYTIGHMVQFVTGLVICFLLFNLFGTIGVAAGIVVSIYINVFFMAFACSRILDIPFYKIWSLKPLAIYFVTALLSSFIAFSICNMTIPNSTNVLLISRLSVGALIVFVLYLLLLRQLKIFDWREWKMALLSRPK